MDKAKLDSIEQLRAIILKEDRTKIEKLQHTLENREALTKAIQPIIEERIDFFKEEFPTEFKQVIDKFIDKRIKESQNEILDVIYPVMGKMIQKYVQYQFELLKERIEKQLRRTSFFSNLFRRKTAKQEAAVILSQVHDILIEEIYVIQKNSGLLLGSAARGQGIDSDMLAGMLTAIKLFAEDAFSKDHQEIDAIGYDNFEINIQNFHTYYFAVVVNGSLSSAQKMQLREDLFRIGETVSGILNELEGYQVNAQINRTLESFFVKSLMEGKSD